MQAGGDSADFGSNIAVEASGNCYVAGRFGGAAIFGAGETTLTSTGGGDIFVAKYTTDGMLLWVNQGSGQV